VDAFYASLSISVSLDCCGIIANEGKTKACFRFDRIPQLEALLIIASRKK